jgi:DNA ligase-associated metallophosphoesterase
MEMKNSTVELQLRKQHLELFPDRSLFWAEGKMLVLSDIHLGKAMHFRKSGIQLPRDIILKDLERLANSITSKKVQCVLFLGDLFHSYHNVEWEIFCDFLKYELPDYEFILVAGNHDILSFWDYDRAGIQVKKELYKVGPFAFSHHPLDNYTERQYLFAGHIHPGVRLKGHGRQSLRLPCFCFGEHTAIMPAFGSLTGIKVLRPKASDEIYVITDTTVMKV